GGEGVIGVVEAAERKLDADAADAQRDAVESVQLDVGRGQVGCRPGEVSVRAATNAVVAHVHGIEDQTCAAARARPRVGGMRELMRGDGWIVESEPERLALQVEADLGN